LSKNCRPVGFFAFWFAVNLAPTSSIIPLEDVITDRWLYLPSVGFAVILAFAAEWLYRTKVVTKSRAWKLVFFFLCALVVELYGFATTLRNFTWTSDWTLWEDAATKSPNKARPHIALGLALNEAGHQEEAIREFKKAMQLDPKDGRGYLNLGLIYFNKGWFEESIQVTQQALSLSPGLASEGHNNIGLACMKQGRRQEAMQEMLKAIQARPINAGPYFNLGNLYSEEGNWHKATSCMEKVIELEPEFYLAHEALSRLYEKKGWKEKSQEAYKKYLKYAPPSKKSPPTP
jgi:Tfp pilus assembly protein PilF